VFQDSLFQDIKHVMGCLLFSGKTLAETPYGHFTSAAMLDDVAKDFVQEACGILGQVCFWSLPLPR
jgi:hypothetical protein